MRSDAGGLVYVLQLWFPKARAWRDIREFLDRAEAAYLAARSSEEFPLDKFRLVERPGCLDGANPFPRSFNA